MLSMLTFSMFTNYVYELSFPLEKAEKQTKRAVNTLFIKLFDFSRWKAEFF